MLLKESGHAERLLEFESIIKDLEEENATLEQELIKDNRNIGKEKKENQLGVKRFIFNIKRLGDQNKTGIRNEYERQIKDIKMKYDMKSQKIR